MELSVHDTTLLHPTRLAYALCIQTSASPKVHEISNSLLGRISVFGLLLRLLYRLTDMSDMVGGLVYP